MVIFGIVFMICIREYDFDYGDYDLCDFDELFSEVFPEFKIIILFVDFKILRNIIGNGISRVNYIIYYSSLIYL